MPDWLELELAHHLSPVEAPKALAFQAPGRPAPRRSFHLVPFLATAAAVALLLLAAPHNVSSPAEINRYFRWRAGIDLPIPEGTQARISRAGVIDEGGVRMASVTFTAENREATVRIARASTVRGVDWKSHGKAYVIASAEGHLACVLCHSDL